MSVYLILSRVTRAAGAVPASSWAAVACPTRVVTKEDETARVILLGAWVRGGGVGNGTDAGTDDRHPSIASLRITSEPRTTARCIGERGPCLSATRCPRRWGGSVAPASCDRRRRRRRGRRRTRGSRNSNGRATWSSTRTRTHPRRIHRRSSSPCAQRYSTRRRMTTTTGLAGSTRSAPPDTSRARIPRATNPRTRSSSRSTSSPRHRPVTRRPWTAPTR